MKMIKFLIAGLLICGTCFAADSTFEKVGEEVFEVTRNKQTLETLENHLRHAEEMLLNHQAEVNKLKQRISDYNAVNK